ncbi:MAG: SGNH/GDSL hydrolase family protein [Cyclobacteriaceae bacterium]
MDKKNLSFSCLFLLFIFLTTSSPAQDESLKFELQDGERVVFLGNSLFENEQQFNFLELALTSRWPERKISFRNLGWSGDTVFGEARSYYTSPPSAYELLIDQLSKTQPDIVFLAYGGIEALDNSISPTNFRDGLERLLDTIQNLGAQPLLLSPIPRFKGVRPELLKFQNEKLVQYGKIISNTGSERNIPFLDIYTSLLETGEKIQLSDNGFHLNEAGYDHLTRRVENLLGLSRTPWTVSINAKTMQTDSNQKVTIFGNDLKDITLEFEVEDDILPLVPSGEAFSTATNTMNLIISGLKKGTYQLTIDGRLAAVGTAKAWAKGINLQEEGSIQQSIKLRKLIHQKDEVYFHQYRPQNRTYIIGFRSYEQGRHKKGLEDLDVLLNWLEGQIHHYKNPSSYTYRLSPIE